MQPERQHGRTSGLVRFAVAGAEIAGQEQAGMGIPGNEGNGAAEGRAGRFADVLRALRPIDDEFMRVMLKGRLDLAQGMLRTILDIPGLVLVAEGTQHDIRIPGARSVVLDVFGEGPDGTRYDIEIERSARRASPRRARYHASAMDVEALSPGGGFDDLPEAYVVFVTEEDVRGRGEAVYRFERADTRTGEPLGDGAHVVYANASYEGGGAIGALMHDLLCSDPGDMLTPALAERARYFKENPEGVAEMSGIMESIYEEGLRDGEARGRKEGEARGRKEGEARGRKDGEARGRLAALAEMVADGLLPADTAAERAGMPPDQFATRAREAGYAL